MLFNVFNIKFDIFFLFNFGKVVTKFALAICNMNLRVQSVNLDQEFLSLAIKLYEIINLCCNHFIAFNLFVFIVQFPAYTVFLYQISILVCVKICLFLSLLCIFILISIHFVNSTFWVHISLHLRVIWRSSFCNSFWRSMVTQIVLNGWCKSFSINLVLVNGVQIVKIIAIFQLLFDPLITIVFSNFHLLNGVIHQLSFNGLIDLFFVALQDILTFHLSFEEVSHKYLLLLLPLPLHVLLHLVKLRVVHLHLVPDWYRFLLI